MVQFLGYNLKYNPVEAASERTQAITDYPTQSTRRKLKKFLALIIYDRMFVENLPRILKPMYNKIKEVVLKWTNEDRNV